VKNPNALAIVADKTVHSAQLKELLYETWLFLADRSPSKTLKLIEKQLERGNLPSDMPTIEQLPTLRTLQRWIKDEDWDGRANSHIKATAKHIDETQISRMFVISDLALSFAHQLLEAGYNPNDHAGVLAVKWDAAKEMLRFRGLGTAGAGMAPVLEINVTTSDKPDMSLLSLEERSALMKDGILKAKEKKRLTGHSS
jgi:hypothetical protein